jgi:hypothetical protein
MSDPTDFPKSEAADAPAEAAKPAMQPPPRPVEPHPLAAMHHADSHEDEDAERLKVYLTGPTAFCA